MDQIPLAPNSYSSVLKTPANRPNYLILFLIVLLILALPVSFYLGMSYASLKTSQVSITNSAKSSSSNPSTVNNSTPTPTSTSYPKRQFDSNSKFAGSEPYPVEITSIADDQLIGMKCSPLYRYSDGWIGPNGPMYSNSNGKELYAQITKLAGFGQEVQLDLQYCQTEDGREIFTFDGGHFALLDKDSSFYSLGNLHPLGDPYFTCPTPLQLTAQKLYYICESGDGGFSSTYLFSFNLSAKTHNQLRQCDGQFDDQTGKTSSQCK